MKKLTYSILHSYAAGLCVASFGGMLIHWLVGMWELSVLVGIAIFAGYLRDSISTYSAFRRNPEYMKDTKEKD